MQVWNDELARVAQEYANRCVFEHNPDRTDQVMNQPFTSVGENLYATSRDPADVVAGVQDWYDEVADYDFNSNTCSNVCGHYTQVGATVVATSSQLAC